MKLSMKTRANGDRKAWRAALSGKQSVSEEIISVISRRHRGRKARHHQHMAIEAAAINQNQMACVR